MASNWEAEIMWLSTNPLSDYFWILNYLNIKSSIKKFIEEKQHTVPGQLKILILAFHGKKTFYLQHQDKRKSNLCLEEFTNSTELAKGMKGSTKERNYLGYTREAELLVKKWS